MTSYSGVKVIFVLVMLFLVVLALLAVHEAIEGLKQDQEENESSLGGAICKEIRDRLRKAAASLSVASECQRVS